MRYLAPIFILMFVPRFISAGDSNASIPPTAVTLPEIAATPDAMEVHLKAARALFQKKSYTESLKEFTAALALNPEHRPTRYQTGLAAYWARQPALALELWNGLLKNTARNSLEEWDLERHRLMALSDLRQYDAAELVVERLYELRRETRLPAAVGARGFVRGHIYLKDVRVKCWEVLDDRNEAQNLWAFSMTALDDDILVKRLTVEITLLPGGGPGFILAEEGSGYRRIYKRWVQRPDYAECRALVVQALRGKLIVLEEEAVNNTVEFPAPATHAKSPDTAGPLAPKTSTVPASTATAPKESASTAPATAGAPPDPLRKPVARPPVIETLQLEAEYVQQIKAMGLEPAVTQLMIGAARLREVQFDVTRLTRLSLADPEMANRYLAELSAKAPTAQQDAADFVELVAKAKTAQIDAFFAVLPKLGDRKPFLEFSLLTGLNTRGGDTPATFFEEELKSTDFMVRQTAALIVGRQGERSALDAIFHEVEASDGLGCSILQGTLVELLGAALPPPPAPDAKNENALKAWKKLAAGWWHAHGSKLKYTPNPKVGEPFWVNP